MKQFSIDHPVPQTPDFSVVQEHISWLMSRLHSPETRFFKRPYLLVSGGADYSGNLFVWDQFHMALRFGAAGHPEYFLYLCENVLEHQETGGFTPNCILRGRGPRGSETRFHAQPYLARAAFAFLKQTGDKETIRGFYPKLAAYLGYYEAVHLSPNGLYRWAWPFHSGFDNDPATTFHLPDSITSADLSSFLVLEYQALAALAEICDPENAERLRNKADNLAARIRGQLWCAEAGTFAAWDLLRGRHVLAMDGMHPGSRTGAFAYHSCSNLIPLYAGIATREQARTMIEKFVIHPDHFWSPWGIRSLSRSSEFHNNAVWGNPPRHGNHLRPTNSNWQGPVWVPLSFFMHRALSRYGFTSHARELEAATHRVLANSIETIGSFSENYSSETGMPLYAREISSWNILADVFHEDLVGEFPADFAPATPTPAVQEL